MRTSRKPKVCLCVYVGMRVCKYERTHVGRYVIVDLYAFASKVMNEEDKLNAKGCLCVCACTYACLYLRM